MANDPRDRRRLPTSALDIAHRVAPDEDDDRLEIDDDLGDCWIAHDEPGRPFSFGMWMCDCAACLHALRGEVAARPETAMVLTTARDRIVVTARQLLDALERSSAEALCRPGETVREIFVASAARQPRGARRAG